MSKKIVKPVATPKESVYTAKVTEAKKGFSMVDNQSYLDVTFNILLNNKVVAERRLAFPIGTTEEAITKLVKQYCKMFENDHALAADAKIRSEADAEAEGVLKQLRGKEI